MLAVSGIVDESSGDAVVATAISVHSDVPDVVTRSINIDSRVSAEGVVLVVICEDGGALVLANVEIAVSVRQEVVNGVKAHSIGSGGAHSIVVPGEGLYVAVVGGTEGHRGSLSFTVLSRVSSLARADRAAAESTHRATVGASVSVGHSQREAASRGFARVPPDSNEPVARSGIRYRHHRCVVH